MAKNTEFYSARLFKIESMTPTVRNFHFEFPGQKRFDFEPGQFVMVEVPKDDKKVRKPYSIASAPHWQDRIELCIKKVEGGYVSSYFFELEEGQTLPMEAPLGVFKLKDPLPSHLIFVATGTGIAPLRAQIHTLYHRGYTGKITLILGVRYENEILFDAEFQELTKTQSNFEYIPVVSRPKDWQGAKGYVQEQIRARYSEPQGQQIYACGLVPMINSLKETLLDLKYPKEALHFERWT